jgi:phosphoribosylformylglycinamidine cyclo-ligase
MKYDQRGVSASKSEVHTAIAGLSKGLYPNAFCTILPDVVANDKDFCSIMHADTAGTKTSLAYLYWRETGDISVWKNIVQDAMVMNTDDLACVGLVDNMVVSSTIGRNKRYIPGEVLTALIQGAQEFMDAMSDMGVKMHSAGGETADVGDIVRTIDVGFTVFGRMRRSDVLENNIQMGDVIVGIASDGQANYEKKYNSGIGSNGLTGARHDTLSKYYATHFPEAFDTAMPESVAFTGSRRLTDTFAHERFGVFGESQQTIGELLLSPTRTHLPILKRVFATFNKSINGIIHCTGGGQTKVEKFVPHNFHIIKDNLLPTAPVFEMIQAESNTDWREMYQVFNMGHRLEFYLNEKNAQNLIDLVQSFGLEAQIIGRVAESATKKVTVSGVHGTFEYDF